MRGGCLVDERLKVSIHLTSTTAAPHQSSYTSVMLDFYKIRKRVCGDGEDMLLWTETKSDKFSIKEAFRTHGYNLRVSWVLCRLDRLYWIDMVLLWTKSTRSDIYPSLEKICLEGSRAQSKFAVSAIAALVGTPEQFVFSELCKVY
ncbi:hypothetical protein CK203_071709 [Vitis vinifera]|uniref:Uncharacterized protein n=1 Tax=Vitis vinifera TaxID=29760 RepID=A0A438C349_VITVI|nr:hypothetical protein CK203_071709 [Vitis vinifera]